MEPIAQKQQPMIRVNKPFRYFRKIKHYLYTLIFNTKIDADLGDFLNFYKIHNYLCSKIQ